MRKLRCVEVAWLRGAEADEVEKQGASIIGDGLNTNI